MDTRDIIEGIEDILGMSEMAVESNYELGLMYAESDGKRFRITVEECFKNGEVND